MLNYQIQGEGYPVLLIHGLFGSLENLNSIARDLKEHFKVINIDLPNHGKSPRADEVSYQQTAEQINLLREHLAIQQWHVLGHSMGGKTAMNYALSYPDQVNRLIVADISPVQYERNHDAVIAGLKSVPLHSIANRQQADEYLAQHIQMPGVRQFLLKSLYKDGDVFNWRFNLDVLVKDYEKIIQATEIKPAISHKVLFIKGQNSDYILPEHRPEIARLFPNAQAKVIHNTGHWLHAEKPAAFNRVVNQFLAE